MISKALIPIETIGTRILLIRGQKVMLDLDLAELYRVPTKRLNEQVRRNKARFPKDFMFQLTWEESEQFLRSQIATLKQGKHLKYRPYAFTEQGVAMLSSVLHSPRAIQVNIDSQGNGRNLDITNCDIKFGSRRQQTPALRFH